MPCCSKKRFLRSETNHPFNFRYGSLMTVLFIVLLHAIPVVVIAVWSKNKIALSIAAIISAIIGVAVGNPAYIAFDLIGVAVAFGLGMSFISSRKPIVPPNSLSHPPKLKPLMQPKAPLQIKFVSVIALCLVGAIIIASKHMEIQVDDLGFMLGSMVGRFLVAFMALVAVAILGFGVTWIIRPLRPMSSPVAGILAVLLFLGLFVDWRPTTTLDARLPLAQQQPQLHVRATKENAQRQTYDRTVQAIEREHPRLNPDSPKYDEKFVQIILNSAKAYVKRGLTEHDAIVRAVRDSEAPKVQKKTVQTSALRDNVRPADSATSLPLVRATVSFLDLASDEQEAINAQCHTALPQANSELAQCISAELRKLAESEHGSEEMRAWRRKVWRMLPDDLERYVRTSCKGRQGLGIVSYSACLKEKFIEVTKK